MSVKKKIDGSKKSTEAPFLRRAARGFYTEAPGTGVKKNLLAPIFFFTLIFFHALRALKKELRPKTSPFLLDASLDGVKKKIPTDAGSLLWGSKKRTAPRSGVKAWSTKKRVG